MILILSDSETLLIQQHLNLSSFLLPSSLFVDVLSLITIFQFLHLVPISHLNLHFPHLNPLKFRHLNRSIPFKRNLISVKSSQRLPLSFIHVSLLPPNSASKYTTSSLDNLLETTSESTIRQPPRHRYNLRNNRRPTPSLASTNSSLLRHHDQSLSTDSLSIPDNAPTCEIDTAFSQRSFISSYNETGHLFSRQISQNSSVLSSDSHLIKIDLTTDQYPAPPTPNRVEFPLIVNDTLINSPRQDLRFLYLATHKLNSNPNISNERRHKKFHRLDNPNLEIKLLLNSTI